MAHNEITVEFEINGRRFQVVGKLKDHDQDRPKNAEEGTRFFWDNIYDIPLEVQDVLRGRSMTFNWRHPNRPFMFKTIVWSEGPDGIAMDWMLANEVSEDTLLLRLIS